MDNESSRNAVSHSAAIVKERETEREREKREEIMVRSDQMILTFNVRDYMIDWLIYAQHGENPHRIRHRQKISDFYIRLSILICY